ncbi:MAG: hypothetical protein QXL17_07885 [Candidatus Thermoplasmatota archaeon]
MVENSIFDFLKATQEQEKQEKARVTEKKTDVITELIKQISDTSIEPREKMYVDMGKMLFDVEKIKMISRIDKKMIYYFIVNYIALYFYFDFYRNFRYKLVYSSEEKKVTCTHMNGLLDIRECPLCGGVGEYVDERLISRNVLSKREVDNLQKLVEKYEILLNDILQLFISEQGKGRDEVIRIMNGITEEMRQSMIGRLSGLMGKNVRDVENV